MALGFHVCVALFFFRISTGQEVSFEPECPGPPQLARTLSPLPSFNTERIWYSEKDLYDLPERQVGCEVDSEEAFLVVSCKASTQNIFPWINATRKIAQIFPRRGLILRLKFENNVSHLLLNSQLFEPVRNQLVDLSVSYADAKVTQRIHGCGVLSNLIKLNIIETLDMRIRKVDFSAMPNIQVMVFNKCTFAHIEAFTFTDLPGLKTLALEVTFSAMFDGFGWHGWPVLSTTDALRNLRELHCGCSYTWLRNFLKRKPELAKTNLGETTTIGSYKATSIIDNRPNVLVDCAVETTQDYVEGPGTWSMYPVATYSINTNCQTAVC